VSSVQYLIGKTLAKYEILEHLGHGGMSEVYKGQQAKLNRMVAVKVLHPFLADDEGFVVRFQREARIVATLRHPNIVQVYDFDYHDELGIYYMVMEYIDGKTLKDVMEKGLVSPEETIRVGSAIADALDYAHQRGMVHRDIKPANIMFLSDRDPVLTDFGIARMLTLSGLTASGAMVGTPAYMAPEIGIGKAGSSASDIYSLSVVLFHAVTGSLPFVSETPMGMVMDHINKPPPRPSIYAPHIPPALEQVILRGMEKDTGARFRTAGDMALALRQVLNPLYSGPSVTVATPASQEVQHSGTDENVHLDLPRRNENIQTTRVREELGARPRADNLEDDDWLLKSWPTDGGVEPVPWGAVPQVAVSQVEESAPPAVQPRPALRKRRIAPFAWLLLVTLVGLAGIGLWKLDGSWDALRMRLRTVDTVGTVSTAGIATKVPGATAVAPAPLLVAKPELPGYPSTARPAAAPLGSPPVVADCSPRGRVEHVSIEPNARIAPQAPLMAYITLRNYGVCPWLAGTVLQLTSDAPTAMPGPLTVNALEADEIVQILIPLTAPEEPGTYRTTVEMRTAAGGRFGSPVRVEFIVEDLPLQIPTPVSPVMVGPLTPQPLAVQPPILVRWEDQQAQDRWTAIVELAAEGGSGAYRFYQDKLSARTEILDGRIEVVGRRCESVTLSVWILSGNQNVYWQGKVPFPAPERCW
jgi:serine/threonine protein kinase